MSRDYKQGIKGILSLGPTPAKPKIIKSEPDIYEDVFSPDAPVVLTPGVTPKIKKEPGKYYKNLKAQKWITRPTTKTITKAKPKAMNIITYINKINSLYNNSEQENKYPVTPQHFTDRIQEQDRKQKARNNKTNREKTDGQV